MNSKKLWPYNIEVGDKLEILPIWNATERYHKISVPVIVDGITHNRSQSGVQFHVKTKAGMTRGLDAAWFIQPEPKK